MIELDAMRLRAALPPALVEQLLSRAERREGDRLIYDEEKLGPTKVPFLLNLAGVASAGPVTPVAEAALAAVPPRPRTTRPCIPCSRAKRGDGRK